MAIENSKLVNLQDAKVLYDDLRNRVKSVNESIGTVPTGENVEGQIAELEIGKAPAIEETLSTEAAIAEITDAAANLSVKLTVGIDPVQDLHGFDFPWIGGAGKNLAIPYSEATTIKGITITPQPDGSVILNGTKDEGDDEGFRVGEMMTVYEGNTYTCSIGSNDASITNYGLKGYSYAKTYTIVNTYTACGVLVKILGGTQVDNVRIYPQIELGSTATDFEPYENICPISGWTGCKVTRTGKNFVDVSLADWKLDYRISEDGEEVSNAAYKFTQYYYRVNGGGTVSVSFVGDSGYTSRLISLAVYDSNKQFIERVTLINADTPIPSGYNKATATLPNGASYVRFIFPKGLGITNLMLEYAPDATTFEPFGTIFDITFPAGAGTVYGGTLTVNKDGSGTLVVDKVMANLKGLSNSNLYLDKSSSSEVSNIVKTNYYSDKKYGTGQDKAFITAEHKWIGNDTAGNFRTRLKNGECGGQASSVMIWIRDDRIADDTLYPTDNDKKTAFKSLLTDGTIVYPIANPIPHQFTPGQVKSLLGYNAMWADTGNIKGVDYCADTKSYIDNLFSSILPAMGVSF